MTAPRHFLTLMDLAPDEIRALIARAIELKAHHRAGTAPRTLEGKVLAMIFTKASTRTRVSFDVGMSKRSDHDDIDHRGDYAGAVRDRLTTSQLGVLTREKQRAATELRHAGFE